MKYFDSYYEFITTVQKHQKYLTGCFNCNFVWLPKKIVMDHRITEENMEEIQRCLFDINNLCITVPKLDQLKIKISHGLCTPCYRLVRTEKNRNEQRLMGYDPCYGTADDGFCTQPGCKWYNVCVVDQNELKTWREKIAIADTMTMATISIH